MQDVLELKATVVYVRRHTLQVEVDVEVLMPPWEAEGGPHSGVNQVCMYVCMYMYMYTGCIMRILIPPWEAEGEAHNGVNQVCMYVCMYVYVYVYIYSGCIVNISTSA